MAGVSKSAYARATAPRLDWAHGTSAHDTRADEPRRPKRGAGMIALSLKEIAAITGGTVVGDGVRVPAPAVLDGRRSEPGGLFVAFDGEHVDGHDYAAQARE